MLAPEDRALLLDSLRPTPGFRLDAAVATTFTLDLQAALVPPLAFASFRLTGTPDPIALLESVRSSADRIDIFCQAGQIAVPAAASDLLAFLEPMIHQIPTRRGGLFHPKLWLLRFVSELNDPDEYRLLVLSRNLTRDASWDIALRLDAARGTRVRASNRPLAELVRSLPAQATPALSGERRDRVLALAEDARYLEWEKPDLVDEVSFHVFGVDGVKPAPDFNGYRQMVIAPFADEAGLDLVAPSATDVTLLSRQETLDALGPDLHDQFECLVLSPLAGLPADDEQAQPSGGPGLLAGLHAKAYIVERARRAHVFLGSANATGAAFTRNVELLVELNAGATKLGVDTFIGINAPFRTLTEPYQPGSSTPEDEAGYVLENLLRGMAAVAWTIEVQSAIDSVTRSLSIASGRLPSRDAQLQIELMTRPGRALRVGATAEAVTARFEQVPIPDITPFLSLRVRDDAGNERSAIVCGRLLNDPAERLDEILARQIDTPEKFLRFLMLLLGLADGALPPTGDLGGGSRQGQFAQLLAGGILEVLVGALADRPQVLTDLDRLIERLSATAAGRATMPAGFSELWKSVSAARDMLGIAS